MRKDKNFTFYNGGMELCHVTSSPDQAHPFEIMIRRMCRYAGRFGYSISYDVKNVEQKEKTMTQDDLH